MAWLLTNALFNQLNYQQRFNTLEATHLQLINLKRFTFQKQSTTLEPTHLVVTKSFVISVDSENEFYATDLYGSLLNKQQTIYIQAVPTVSKVVIPHTVHTIYRQAFDYGSLTSEIIITGNIKKIGISFCLLKQLKTFVYYGHSPIPDDAFDDTIPEEFIVCNDYPGTQILGVNLNKTGYCYRRFYQQKNKPHITSIPLIATMMIIDNKVQ